MLPLLRFWFLIFFQPKEAEKMLDSLIKISSNYYRNKVIESLKINVSGTEFPDL